MRKLASIFLPLLTVSVGTALATTTDELEFKLGSAVVTISDTGVCSSTGPQCGTFLTTAGSNTTIAAVDGKIGNWEISLTAGANNSPGIVPYGIDISSLTATCTTTCAGNPLEIIYSATGFTAPATGFTTTYSGTIVGSNASTTESAYFTDGATLLAETNLIGTVGPLTNSTSSFGGTVSGPATGLTEPYTLTLEQDLTATSGGAISFSMDGDITGVPEPSAITLFGAVLFGCVCVLRRRKVLVG